MEPSQRRADPVNGGGGNEQEGGHERKDALEHQRRHGNQAPGDGHRPDIQQNLPVQKGIYNAHGAHQRQHQTQLIKAGGNRNLRDLVEDHGVQHQNHQSRQVILGKGHHGKNIQNGDGQLRQGVQPMDGGSALCQLIHFPELRLGLCQLVHRKSSTDEIGGTAGVPPIE